MIQSIRALTDAGFIVDTARNGFIGLNKMLSSTFPNTLTCFSTAPTPAPIAAPAPVAVTVAVAVTAIADPKNIAVEIISNESCSKNKNMNTNDDISQGVESNGKITGAWTGTGTGIGTGTGTGSKHLVVDTTSVSVEGTTVAEVSPEVIKPFDYVLMDIQMPVMGKGSRINCLLCHGTNISFYIILCHVISCYAMTYSAVPCSHTYAPFSDYYSFSLL